MIGTRGVPARYGGFETCVEEVGRRLASAGHEVTVYCRGSASPGCTAARDGDYLGMHLVHLPAVRHKALETLSHTALSTAHSARRGPDAAFVFNAANAPLLPVLRACRVPVATHVDGLEWKRGKWGRAGRRYYRLAESLAVRWSDALIADARGIQEYYMDRFGASSEYIAYGAPVLDGVGSSRLAEYGLRAGEYHLVVARFEPENHVHLAVEGYRAGGCRFPLVVVGSAPYAGEYVARLTRLAAGDESVRFLGGVWDQELLDELYANALTYIHGHSVGGTNPSLLRAIGAGTVTLAYDVGFNREVLGQRGQYFAAPDELARLCTRTEAADPAVIAERGRALRAEAARYDWDEVAGAYETLAGRLARHSRSESRWGA
ncbi:Glycosyltransferase involved in cell wall bisynthesis [Haloechinothrix alba]|uniref:Glycosyltransferase involved in cell wall bisynthesis n=2 Tax=Haloechinothrix alba TaxID=664784 RepID=A0A238X0E8_9PSEU|nr:Glycosyltransferase involved in cell wall bisynthesis [Haloechinothrix alba]